MSKVLNALVAITIVLMFATLGLFYYSYANELSLLDALHDNFFSSLRTEYEDSNTNDLSISQSNASSNNSHIVYPSFDDDDDNSSLGTTIIPVFTGFIEMYQYADKVLNNATNIHSAASGTLTLDGKVDYNNMIDLALDKADLAINVTRAQNASQSFMDFTMIGDVTISSIYPMDVEYITRTYSQGSNYYHYSNTERTWAGTSRTALYDLLAWDTSQTIHIINNNSVASSSYYTNNGLHYGTATLITDISATNASVFMQGVSASESPAEYKTTTINVIVDSYGKFKSITLKEEFFMKLQHKETGAYIHANCVTNYTETFYVIDHANVTITSPI